TATQAVTSPPGLPEIPAGVLPSRARPCSFPCSFPAIPALPGPSVTFFQAVAHAPHGGDPVGAELPTQVTDVDVDDVGTGIEVVAPHLAEQLFPGQHLPRVPQERLGERELPSRQIHRLAAHVRTSRPQVQ